MASFLAISTMLCISVLETSGSQPLIRGLTVPATALEGIEESTSNREMIENNALEDQQNDEARNLGKKSNQKSKKKTTSQKKSANKNKHSAKSPTPSPSPSKTPTPSHSSTTSATASPSATMPVISQAWKETFNAGQNYYSSARDLVVDSQGYIYMMGDGQMLEWPIVDPHGQADIFIAKYGSAGNLMSRSIKGSIDPDNGNGIALTQIEGGDLKVVVTGKSGYYFEKGESSQKGDLCFVSLPPTAFHTYPYTPYGGQAKTFRTGFLDEGRSITSASDGSAIYITGITSAGSWEEGYSSSSWYASPRVGWCDIVVIKLNSNNEMVWTKLFGTIWCDTPYSIALSSDSQDIYLAGSTNGLSGQPVYGSNDMFVMKLDSSGTLIWTRTRGTSGDDELRDVEVVSDGVLVAGSASASMDGSDAMGGVDIVLMKYDFDGNHLWTKQRGGAGADYGYSLDVSATGIIYVAGSSNSGTIDGKTNAAGTTTTTRDAVVMRFESDGTWLGTMLFGTTGNDVANAIVTVGPGGDFCVAGETPNSNGYVSAATLWKFTMS